MVNHLQANLVQMLKVATVTFVTFQQAKGPAIDNFEKNLGPLGLNGWIVERTGQKSAGKEIWHKQKTHEVMQGNWCRER